MSGEKLGHTRSEAPRYEHDCDACVALGHYSNYDLYFCLQGGRLPTVIARYGAESSYLSGIVFAESNPAIAEAVKRARAWGLLDHLSDEQENKHAL